MDVNIIVPSAHYGEIEVFINNIKKKFILYIIMDTPLTPEEERNLHYAVRYYSDAPIEVWYNPTVLKIVYAGGWGRGVTHIEGGLMGMTVEGYTFSYKGFPIWD